MAFAIATVCISDEVCSMVAFNLCPRTVFHVNDVVAVIRRLPCGDEVISITKIKSVGAVLIETTDHRVFSAAEGLSLGGRQTCFIEPANHRDLRCAAP